MPNDLLPPDSSSRLYAQRPVRSDFVRRGPSYAMRRFITLAVLAGVIGGGFIWKWGWHSTTTPGQIPTIKAEGSYKQRPEEPGGLDIPHRDVQVYQELDKNNASPAAVEHLLPPPEIPQIATPMPVSPVAETLTPVSKAAHVVAPTIESLPPLKTESIDDILGEKTAPATIATTVMPETLAVKTAIPDPVIGQPAESLAVLPSHPMVMRPAVAISNPSAKAASGPGVKAAAKPAPRSIDQILKEISSAPKAPANDLKDVNTATEAAAAHNTDASKDTVIQMASVADHAGAQQVLNKLQTQYASTLDGVQLRLVKAELPKGTFYRIQSPPLSNDRAHTLCSALKTLNAGCILVRP
jgi:hypothetical protein